jgi:hypothetical protein
VGAGLLVGALFAAFGGACVVVAAAAVAVIVAVAEPVLDPVLDPPHAVTAMPTTAIPIVANAHFRTVAITSCLLFVSDLVTEEASAGAPGVASEDLPVAPQSPLRSGHAGGPRR